MRWIYTLAVRPLTKRSFGEPLRRHGRSPSCPRRARGCTTPESWRCIATLEMHEAGNAYACEPGLGTVSSVEADRSLPLARNCAGPQEPLRHYMARALGMHQIIDAARLPGCRASGTFSNVGASATLKLCCGGAAERQSLVHRARGIKKALYERQVLHPAAL